MIRLLALSWVWTPRLFEHPLSEGPPDWTLCLLLHQGAQGQVLGEDVGLCAGVADVPEEK